jgi:hypothetical protein
MHGFPNDMYDINIWGKCLPRFQEEEDDIHGQHLQYFHEYEYVRYYS